MERLKQLAPIMHEAVHHTLQVAKLCCLLHVSTTYLGGVALPVGPSMLPTIHHGSIVLTESVTKRLGKIRSGDVVIMQSPEAPWKMIAKRIKAVEDEEVSYLVDPKASNELKTVYVPKGHIWVEGDNASSSRDSRQFGPVPYAMVDSRIFYVIWPLSDFGSIGSKALDHTGDENRNECEAPQT